MKTKNKYLSIFICTIACLHICTCISAQNKYSDSLLSLLKNDKEDTNKVIHLDKLAFSISRNNPDSTILLATQTLALGQKLNFKRGIANAYSTFGIAYWTKGDYPKAIEN